VTVNGKKRGTFMAAPTATDEQLRLGALALESVARNLKGLTIKKVITVRRAGSNLINFVAAP
jgi:leucyl-tRNA synthetase